MLSHPFDISAYNNARNRSHLRRTLDQLADPALGTHPNVQRGLVHHRARGQRQRPGGRVRHVLVEVVRVAARVGDVLQLRHERRVQREHVPVRLHPPPPGPPLFVIC